jgi:hypothetical protein
VDTVTMNMRGRRVTHDEALKSAHRLINSHFHNPDSARCSIPVNAADDDVTIIDYIHEQMAAAHSSHLSPEETIRYLLLSEDAPDDSRPTRGFFNAAVTEAFYRGKASIAASPVVNPEPRPSPASPNWETACVGLDDSDLIPSPEDNCALEIACPTCAQPKGEWCLYQDFDSDSPAVSPTPHTERIRAAKLAAPPDLIPSDEQAVRQDPCEMSDKQYENYIYGDDQTRPPRPYLTEDGNGNKTHYHADIVDAYIAALEAELSSLRSNVATAVESLEELGLPVRERYGHSSAWQYKVKLHREILALLRPPLKKAQEDER